MKQSPYAAYFLARETKQEIINTNIEILTRLTHNHPTSVIASQVHNQFLMELLKSK
jgi:ADP-ribosylglycohydrolase